MAKQINKVHISVNTSGKRKRPEVTFASPEAVAIQAERWSDQVLACRGPLRHSWQAQNAMHNARLGYFYTIVRCTRCGTRRHQEMSESGRVYSTWYTYPDGYYAPGLGRIAGEGNDVLRMAAMKRVFRATELQGRKLDQDMPHSAKTRKALMESDES